MADKKPKDKKQNEPCKNFGDLAKKLMAVPKEVDEKRAAREREKWAG